MIISLFIVVDRVRARNADGLYLALLPLSYAPIRFLLDYPDGRVALGGGPGPDLPPGTITDTPGDPSPFDLEHAIRVVVSAGFTFDTTTIAKINFLGCQGQPAPAAGDYKCIVIDAADGNFQNAPGVTCSVSIP